MCYYFFFHLKMCSKMQLVLVLISANMYSAMRELSFSVSDMKHFFHTYEKVFMNFEKYMDKDRRRIEIIQRYVNHLKNERDIAKADVSNYIGNPINAFRLVKRLSFDLYFMEKRIKKNSKYKKNNALDHPSKRDLENSVYALVRLVKTYQLNITEITNGIIKGTFNRRRWLLGDYVKPMTASDCYEIGRIIADTNDTLHSFTFTAEAINKYTSKTYKEFFSDDVIFTDVKKANMSFDAFASQVEYLHIMTELREKNKAEQEKLQSIKKTVHTYMGSKIKLYNKTDAIKVYRKLCRNERIKKKDDKRLRCYYLTENHPFLKLAPIKTEQLHKKPEVTIFYGVLTSKEVSTLKTITEPKLKFIKETDKVYHISRRTKLRIGKHHVLNRIAQRISDFTGTKTEYGDQLEIENYSVGGYYGLHHDFVKDYGLSGEEETFASVLIYMSNVRLGGATVFPELGLSVFPKPGSAVYWTNFGPNRQRDYTALHASCPVLLGDMWILNKWFPYNSKKIEKKCALRRKL